jgi:hypothetical protein
MTTTSTVKLLPSEGAAGDWPSMGEEKVLVFGTAPLEVTFAGEDPKPADVVEPGGGMGRRAGVVAVAVVTVPLEVTFEGEDAIPADVVELVGGMGFRVGAVTLVGIYTKPADEVEFVDGGGRRGGVVN